MRSLRAAVAGAALAGALGCAVARTPEGDLTALGVAKAEVCVRLVPAQADPAADPAPLAAERCIRAESSGFSDNLVKAIVAIVSLPLKLARGAVAGVTS